MPLVCAIALLATALLLSGCGGGESVARVQDRHVDISLDEYLIAPQELSAPAGTVTFRVVNHGRLRHSFRLWGADGEPLAVTSLFPGDRATRTAALAPGEYRMVCTIMNHAELGMTGRLMVR
jgi:plastocyanin